jgi:2'-5' RNA ligase
MSINLFQSQGILRYETASYGPKLTLEIDKEIAYYYSSLIPKYYTFQSQMYAPHITIVRKENPTNLEFWGKYEGEIITFSYTNTIYKGTVYWWLDAFSVRLEDIREELGLDITERYSKPPKGFKKCFHITLGNDKHI